jgi:SAM-dependent methyltransferase
MDYKEYWIKDSLANIVPSGYGQYPEGWNPAVFLSRCLVGIPYATVLDFGCGYGRICTAFNPSAYTGIDLNPEAVQKAREQNPGYSFMEVDLHTPLPANELCIAYTVFLHLDDPMLESTLQRIANSKTNYIALAEILGHEWRRDGLPPVFNRTREEYEACLQSIGFRLLEEYRRPYQRYSDNPEFNGKNTDLSILIFEKTDKFGNALYVMDTPSA